MSRRVRIPSILVLVAIAATITVVVNAQTLLDSNSTTAQRLVAFIGSLCVIAFAGMIGGRALQARHDALVIAEMLSDNVPDSIHVMRDNHGGRVAVVQRGDKLTSITIPDDVDDDPETTLDYVITQLVQEDDDA